MIERLETDSIRDEKRTIVFFFAPKAQTQIDEEKPSKGSGLRWEGPSGTRGRIGWRHFFRRKCTNPSCILWHPPCFNHKSESGCKYGDKCRFWHVEADGQPSKKSKRTGGKGSVASLQESFPLGCVPQDSHPRRSVQRKEGNLGSNHAVSFSKGTWHHMKIRESKGPSPGDIQKCEPHERSQMWGKNVRRNLAPGKMREWHGICWKMSFLAQQNTDKATFYSSVDARAMPAPTSKCPEEREFVVDSGASMHMSKKDVRSEELETLRRSRIFRTVVTTSGDVQTNEEAQVYVYDLDLFVTVQLLEDTPAVLSLGKL